MRPHGSGRAGEGRGGERKRAGRARDGRADADDDPEVKADRERWYSTLESTHLLHKHANA